MDIYTIDMLQWIYKGNTVVNGYIYKYTIDMLQWIIQRLYSCYNNYTVNIQCTGRIVKFPAIG